MNVGPNIDSRPPRVLIVDDERQNRDLLEAMLAPEGFVLLTATSGEEALAMVAQEPPDLVLLDIMMPGMNGYQVVDKIKCNPATQSIPIIMVTALDDSNSRIVALSAGAEDFLTKPVDRTELRVRVTNLLRLKAYGDYHDKHAAGLTESEHVYRTIFDAAPVGIADVGLDGQWVRVNQRLCDLLGYTRAELLTATVQTLVRGEEAAGETEKRYRRRDGTFLTPTVKTSAIRDGAGQNQLRVLVIDDSAASSASTV